MKASAAIKKFLEMQGTREDMVYPKVPVTEIKEFKDSCTEAEWQQMGQDAAEAMGVELET